MQRAEAAHGGRDAGEAAEGEAADLAGVPRGQDGDAQGRYGGSAGALQHAGAEQHLEGGRERRDQRADRHQHQPGEQRGADADQVGDPTVERRGDGEHEDVEADRPGREPGAHPEVLGEQRERDRGARGAHAGEAEEEAQQHRDPSGVVRGVGAAGGRAAVAVIDVRQQRARLRHSPRIRRTPRASPDSAVPCGAMTMPHERPVGTGRRGLPAVAATSRSRPTPSVTRCSPPTPSATRCAAGCPPPSARAASPRPSSTSARHGPSPPAPTATSRT